MTPVDQNGKGPVRKLGRGLSALLGAPVQIQVPTGASASPTRPVAPVAATAVTSGMGSSTTVPAPSVATPVLAPEVSAQGASLVEIPVEQIVPNRRQPRTDFDDANLQALAGSIKQSGLMQPIMVRPRAGGFELIAGERRWRAAKLIGMTVIPAVVRSLSDQDAAELALVENIQREDLNPMERAFALQRLAGEFSMTHQQIAERVGLDRASVSNLLRLADLDPVTADLIRTGKLSQGHGKALLAVHDLGRRADLAAKSLAGDWSVRELERQAQRLSSGGATQNRSSSAEEPSARQANVADLERQLSEHLGTRVTIQLGRKKGSGRLSIDFFSLDQFDGVMQKIGFGVRGS